MEPIDGPRPVPVGGWSKAILWMELLPCTLDEAIYEAACASRQLFRGVMVEFDGVEIIAFPHQTVSEISRTYARMKQAKAAPKIALVS